MRRILFLIAPVLIAGCIRGPAVNPDPNHTHADFAVWVEGQQLDFSAQKYMSGSSKDEPEGEHTDEDHKHPSLHLHDGNGTVIHRHKPGLPLGEFFTSLGFAMTNTCFTLDTGVASCNGPAKQWTMVVNGRVMTPDPAYVFSDTDKILLTYSSYKWSGLPAGAETLPPELLAQWQTMTDDACLYSRTCPERGEPPKEGCIADPEIPCVAPEE